MINLAMVEWDTKPTKNETQMFNESWSHPNPGLWKIALGYSKGDWGHEQATCMDDSAYESYAIP